MRPFFGNCSKLSVETWIPVGVVDLHTRHTSCLSGSFSNHAACPVIGGASYMNGVTGLLAPGLSSSGTKSFQKQPFGSGTKFISRIEAGAYYLHTRALRRITDLEQVRVIPIGSPSYQ